MRSLRLAVILLCISPSVGIAQVALLEKIFSKLESINATTTAAWLTSPGNLPNSSLSAFGLEASLALGESGCMNRSSLARVLNRCREVKDSIDKKAWYKAVCRAREKNRVPDLVRREEEFATRFGQPTDTVCKAPPEKAEGPLAERAVERTEDGKKITEKYGPAPAVTDGTGNAWLFEAAVGYGLYSGLRRNASPGGLAVYGNVEEFPTLAAYASWRPDGRLSPYAGLRVAVSKLSGFHGYEGSTGRDTVHTASGSSFTAGAAVGLTLTIVPRVEFIGEAGVYWRKFRNVEWSGVSIGMIPVTSSKLPRSLDLSNKELSVGVQVKVN